MMHGAALAVLHITPLSVIAPVQQFICPQTRRGRDVFVKQADVGAKQHSYHTLVDLLMHTNPLNVGVAFRAQPNCMDVMDGNSVR